MRIWAAILCAAALVLTVFLITNRRVNQRKALAASREMVIHMQEAAAWAHVAQMPQEHLRDQLQKDQLDFQAASMEYRIAPPETNAWHQAIAKGVAIQKKIANDNLQIGLNDDIRQRGPDYPTATALDRIRACEQSGAVYSHAVKRDERLAYGAGALWLACGFALGLTKRTA